MGQILQFIRPYDVFDSETLTILSDAFDKGARPGPPLQSSPGFVRENSEAACAQKAQPGTKENKDFSTSTPTDSAARAAFCFRVSYSGFSRNYILHSHFWCAEFDDPTILI
jgi:hypothetical protein